MGLKAHHRVFRRDGGVGWVEKATFASKDETEGFCWGQKPSVSRFDAMEGWGGSKKPTFASKDETEGFCWGQKPSMSRFDAMEGWGGSKRPPSRRKTRRGASAGDRSPPFRVSTRWRGGVGREDHLRVERRDGGLLLGTEALHFAFRRDGGVGWVEKPTVASKHDWGARVVKTAPSSRRNARWSCGRGRTGKTRPVWRVFPVRRVRGRGVGVGDVSLGLGTCR